ncbi:type II secretion system protein GspK [Pseudoalteromonas sp. T1lg23B]|uniref:type II secretion system protein GspK n=1 Tax=Pseudoalteromonas sp. T1lg23B TaxID=2077097 RepID=UPI000CF74E50|nr:type II secretion system protein GspK [Pseudoalteromonas sp. T1lg23B]
MCNYPSRNQGAALLLVLMIAAAMASIMIYMSEKGTNSARMANLIKQHSRAKMQVDSAQAELINELMTTSLGILGPTGSYNGIKAENPSVTNFMGEPTTRDKLTVTVQDASGLVSVSPMNDKAFETLLRYNGASSDDVTRIQDRLEDWQDADGLRRIEGGEKGDYEQAHLPTNTDIQVVEELRYILENDHLYTQIKPFLLVGSYPDIVRQFTPKSLYSAFGFEGRVSEQSSIEGAESQLSSGKLLIQISHNEAVTYSKQFIFERGAGLRPYFISNEQIVD